MAVGMSKGGMEEQLVSFIFGWLSYQAGRSLRFVPMWRRQREENLLGSFSVSLFAALDSHQRSLSSDVD